MTETRLKEALEQMAGEARHARVATDTWTRGRRRHRVAAAGAALAIVAVVASAGLIVRPSAVDTPPAGAASPVVPSTVYPPFTGQPSYVEEPPGPAAILVTGDNELRGSDIWGYEGRSLLVGQNGSYRLARTAGEIGTGSGQLMLSPDGRYLVGRSDLEGADWNDSERSTAAVDLTNGKVTMHRGHPIAFSPTGALLISVPKPAPSPPPMPRQPLSDQEASQSARGFGLLDLQTGEIREFGLIKGDVREGNYVAFSPDGGTLAMATKSALYVIDVGSGSAKRLADLTSSDRLAGTGAWLPDGKRIALYTVDGCGTGDEACDAAALGSRLFRIRYLDAATGQAVPGPALAPARGVAVRMLGWQSDGDAVVAVHEVEAGETKPAGDPKWEEDGWWTVGGVRLMEFKPDGSQRDLVRLPESALFVDVPATLLDSFGGPSPSWLEGALRRVLAWIWPVGQFALLLGLLLLFFAGRAVVRRRARIGAGLHRWRPAIAGRGR